MKNNFKVSIPLAIVLTLVAVIYQRSTGPTYPKKFDLGLEGSEVRVKFPRSHGGSTNAPIEIPKIVKGMSATMHFKRYPTSDTWTQVEFRSQGNAFRVELPNQPPAGKLIYYMSVDYGPSNGNVIQKLGSKEDPIYIRYKGEVPAYILTPHIICMFLSMLLSVVALFEALYRTKSYKIVAKITLGLLLVGGMVLGPIVQKYAFDVYWAGFPYDWDLTDNKLLIGVLAWLMAVILTWKSSRRWPIIIAALVLFVVYSIPHSMQGSEYDYAKGKIITDMDSGAFFPI